MLQRIDLTAGLDDLNSVLPRAATDVAAAAEAVATILADVQARGAEAVMEATERFDGVRPPSLRVPAEVLTAALSGMDPALRAALTESAERARRGHLAQLPQDAETHITPGGTVTQRWIPVRRVGLYVPGGRALYPSTVVMNVVPAQVAGVGQIAITSPAQADNDGWPDPGVLAACALLGVDEVYSAGGAQGIALLGFGSKTDPVVEPVDVLTGPGNIYVTAAKRALRGRVAIDSEAGPTEIAVIADETADPVHVALDLISQAEHDPLACSVLITTSAALADAVDAELARRVPATRHAERIAEALSGKQSGTHPRRIAGRRGGGRERLRRRAPGGADRRRQGGGHADHQCRRHLRRSLVPGLARRLLRRLQPRAAHRRARPVLVRTEHHHVPALGAGHRVHRGRARRGDAVRAGALGGREPARARRSRCRPVRPGSGRWTGPDDLAPVDLAPVDLASGTGAADVGRHRSARRSRVRPCAWPTCRCARIWSAAARTAHRNWTCRCRSTPTRIRTRRRGRWSTISPLRSPRPRSR